jgi:hypothetical protein
LGSRRGIIERLSWKSIIGGGITAFTVFYMVPDYVLNLRPRIVASIGSDTLSFIEGAILGAITVLLVLKLFSQKPARTSRGRKKATENVPSEKIDF